MEEKFTGTNYMFFRFAHVGFSEVSVSKLSVRES